jgi:hypothetical protein
MDRLLDLSKNSLQYENSMWPSMIRKLKVIVYFRKVFLLSKFKYFCFVTILDMSLISRSCKNDHIIFNVGTPSLEARNIRLVNIITYIIEESKLISENMSPMSFIVKFCVTRHQFHVFQTFLHRLLRPKRGFVASNFHLV